MAYGQKNYLQIQGINGRYRIDQIGCFLTAFCNLLERFGVQEIDPVALNSIFVNRGIYIDVDDGVRDDLGWQSITAYNGQIVVTATGTGVPPTSNAIIKVHYRSISNPTLPNGKPNMIDHFCLVADAAAGTIVDSWDGAVKSWNVYGGPVAWAAYANNTPQPVQPPPAPMYEVVENYPNGKQIQLNKQPTNLWGMNYSFDFMKDHPVEVHNQGEVWTVTNKVHHQDGYDYYRRDGQVDGFNVLDCDDYIAPTPAPVEPPVSPQVSPPTPAPTAPAEPADPPKPTTPLDWKLSFKVNDAGKYEAVATGIVKDLEGTKSDLTIQAGQGVNVGGSFEKDGQKYYRAASSVTKGTWYGIPVKLLKPIDPSHDPAGDAMFDGIDLKIEGEQLFKNLTSHEKLVAAVAKLQGFVIRFVKTITFRNKKANK